MFLRKSWQQSITVPSNVEQQKALNYEVTRGKQQKAFHSQASKCYRLAISSLTIRTREVSFFAEAFLSDFQRNEKKISCQMRVTRRNVAAFTSFYCTFKFEQVFCDSSVLVQ